MVVAALIFAVTASASVVTDGTSGTEPTMRKTQLPPIRSVTIGSIGATSPASAPLVECSAFKLSYQEIREYIVNAAEVAEHDYLHMLDWSPCYTSGSVTFKNGVTGVWAIQQYRAGSLKLSNGRTLYLYCPRCQAKAFPTVDE